VRPGGPTVVRPPIGITTGYRGGDSPQCYLAADYYHTILLAGGLPLLLPPVAGELIEQLLSQVSGLLFTGGADVDPATYGEETHPKTTLLDPTRSRFELALARLSAERGVPMMGICLGCQLLNVALGGVLYQHIPEEVPSALPHSPQEHGLRAYHRVQIAPDSRLAGIVGTTELEVNSSHHQAIRELASPLRAVAWSSDGVVEAAEARDDRFILAIQWHPENLAAQRPEHLALFEALVKATQGAG